MRKHVNSTAPLRIIEVASNIKSPTGEPWKVELGYHTLLQGPPESGKTRTMNAIELALTGECSDILFRESGKTPAFLVAFVHPSVNEAFARVKFSNGDTAEWRMKMKDGRGSGVKHDVPEWLDESLALPVSTVRASLRGSADVAARFLLQSTGGSLSWDQVLEGFTPVTRKGIEAVVRKNGIDTEDSVAALTRIREVAAQAKSDHGAARRRLEQEIQSLGSAQAVSEGDVQAAVEAAAGVGDAVKRNHLRDIYQRVLSAHEELADLHVVIRDSDKVLSGPLPVPSQTGSDAEMVARAGVVLTDSIRVAERFGGRVECNVCGQEIRDFTARGQAIRGLLDELHLRTRSETDAMARVKKAREEAIAKKAEAERRADFLDEMCERWRAELAAAGVGAAAEPDWITESPEVEESATTLTEQVRDLQYARSSWLRLQDARSRLEEATTREEGAKAIEAAVKARVREVLDASIGAFEDRVSAFLFDGERARVLVPEAKGDPLVVGRERDGLIHLGLTGSVGARVLMAMAAVIGRTAPFAIVLQEDRAMDVTTLRAMLDSLDGAEVQVLAQTVHEDCGAVAGSWSIVSLEPA